MIKKAKKCMETIFVWIVMVLYGFVDFCMDISLFNL